MTSTNGWNSADLWAFEQLLIKANDGQLVAAAKAVKKEISVRYAREAEPMSDCCGAAIDETGRCGNSDCRESVEHRW